MDGTRYLEASELRSRPVRVAVSPVPSLSAALRDAAGAARHGTPEAWCAAIRAHLRAQDVEALEPFMTEGALHIPESIAGHPDGPLQSLQEGIEQLLATPGDVLAAEAQECRQVSGNDRWRAVELDPERWRRRYVAALLRAWKGYGPIWRSARRALDREIERVAVAAAVDAHLELFDGLLPEAAVRGRRWCIGCDESDGRLSLPERGLMLLPLVGGPRSKLLVGDARCLQVLGYPLRLPRASAGEDHASLEALLGAPRARVLRALTAPVSIGRLAELLHAVPSVATHHVDSLEAAGLVARDRRGRHVLVQRTERGHRLLDLYSGHAATRPPAGVRRHLRAG